MTADTEQSDDFTSMDNRPAEKWKAKARQLCGKLCGGELDDWDGLAIPIIVAALAEAYAAGQKAARYKPGPRVEEYPGD